MNDYAELIERLRNTPSRSKRDLLDEAAEAISSLRAERDKAELLYASEMAEHARTLREAIESRHVSLLGLPTRTWHALIRAGVNTLGDLKGADLLRVSGIGYQAREEIRETVQRLDGEIDYDI